MALILHIDTAVETASVCLARDGEKIGLACNERMKDHAAWLHPAIKEIIQQNGFEIHQLDAIAVTEGPGSYTGLRISMAAAKGICYALNKPLITLNTLLVIANAAKTYSNGLLCPMIDARRMEVFAAIYTTALEVIKTPASIILNENSFEEELIQNEICFFGNGSRKFRELTKNPNAVFRNIVMNASAMVDLSEKKFRQGGFADLAYTEPLYLKEFYAPTKKTQP